MSGVIWLAFLSSWLTNERSSSEIGGPAYSSFLMFSALG